jgi:hypothetical protein
VSSNVKEEEATMGTARALVPWSGVSCPAWSWRVSISERGRESAEGGGLHMDGEKRGDAEVDGDSFGEVKEWSEG